MLYDTFMLSMYLGKLEINPTVSICTEIKMQGLQWMILFEEIFVNVKYFGLSIFVRICKLLEKKKKTMKF